MNVSEELKTLVTLLQYGELRFPRRPPFSERIKHTGWSRGHYLAQATGSGYSFAVAHLPAEAADNQHYQNPYCSPDF